MNRRPRVLLADDHTMLLDAFRRLLEPRCEIVGTACDGRALLELAAKTKPDVIVLDIWDATAERDGCLRPNSPKNARRKACLPHCE